jgi:2,3-bisphosphoglycerate-dependent phosphoglycerate mutase
LVKHLEKISDDDIANLNIPTGTPLLYELDARLRQIRHEYVGDSEQVRKAIEAVAHQGKAAKVTGPASNEGSAPERRTR